MVWRTGRGDHDAARRTSTARVPARRISLLCASALLELDLTTDHNPSRAPLGYVRPSEGLLSRFVRGHVIFRRTNLLIPLLWASCDRTYGSRRVRPTCTAVRVHTPREGGANCHLSLSAGDACRCSHLTIPSSLTAIAWRMSTAADRVF